MARLYLIRHARPAASWGGEDDDPGLDALGQTQALAARDWLLAQREPPTMVVSSPLRRCRETAAPTAQVLGLQLRIEPAVGEIPTPSTLTPEDRPTWLKQAFAGDWRDITGDLDYEAWRRGVAEALAPLAGAAVFSHFVAINAVVSQLTGSDRVLAFRPDHASVTILETEGRRLTLVDKGAEASTSVL